MAIIITRETGPTAKGSPLTNTEVDNNFINLNLELGTLAEDLSITDQIINDSIPEPLDVHGQSDGTNCVFTLRQNQMPISNIYIKDSKDLEVTVSGERYSPYISQKAFGFMPLYEVDSNTFRVRQNRLIIYNAPEVGAKIRVVVRRASTTPQIRRYPFSATTIGLGD